VINNNLGPILHWLFSHSISVTDRRTQTDGLTTTMTKGRP